MSVSSFVKTGLVFMFVFVSSFSALARGNATLKARKKKRISAKYYRLKKGENIVLTARMISVIAPFSREFYNKTTEIIIITEGSRTPALQADRMFDKFKNGGNYNAYSIKKTLYKGGRSKKNRNSLALKIYNYFIRSRSKKIQKNKIIKGMQLIIERQISNKNYVSTHLVKGAIDVRSSQKIKRKIKIFKSLGRKYGIDVHDETKTRSPHYHLNLF